MAAGMTSNSPAGNDPRAARGEWKVLPYSSQIEAVHMAVLHTGKVLYYSGFRVAEAIQTETRLWFPRIGEVKMIPTPGDVFCAGHSFLPDGRLLSTGGTLEYRNLPAIPPWLVRLLRPFSSFLIGTFGRFVQATPAMTGPTFMYLFDPLKEQWEFAGDMLEGRWYPTNTTLPDGRILILSGANEGGGYGQRDPTRVNARVEVYSATAGLKQVALIPPLGVSAQHGSGEEPPHHVFISLYPRMHVLPLSPADSDAYPAGKAFCAGESPDTKFLNLQTWEWIDVAQQNFGNRSDGCSVLLPLRPPDYRARVLVFGGVKDPSKDLTATETAELIDFGQTPYAWEYAAPLRDKRVNACAILLPDGNVIAVGGNSKGLFDNPVQNVEVFDPITGTWSPVAPMSVPRGYHSTAILLPDGRVLSAGTTPFDRHELRMEVFSPPYLFKGARPRIKEVSERVSYGQPFEVRYEYAGAIQSAVLIRPGAVTHAFDMDQRYVELRFDRQGTDRLSIEAPPDEHIAPPGYYMLFLLSDQGVPSEAKFVQLPVRA
jgi:hypothetical protein